MKRQFSFKRTAAAALTAVLGLGCLCPSLTAKAADYTIDESAFSNPQITQGTIYFWEEGLPAVNNSTIRKKYPVLITWDDTYYFEADTSFALACKNNLGFYSSRIRHGFVDDLDSNHDNGRDNGRWGGTKGTITHGTFYQNMGYPSGLLSYLQDVIDLKNLKQYGFAASFSCPEDIPRIMPLSAQGSDINNLAGIEYEGLVSSPVYALVVDYTDPWYYSLEFETDDFFTDGGFRAGQNFICAFRYNIFEYSKEGKQHFSSNGFHWSLYGINDNTARNIVNKWFKSNNNPFFSRTSFSYGNYCYYLNGEIQGPFLQDCAWVAKKVTWGDETTYGFFSLGSYGHSKKSSFNSNVSDNGKTENLALADSRVWLSHFGSNLETRGCVNFAYVTLYRNMLNHQTEIDTAGSNEKSNLNFHCYYAKPMIIDFLSTDFTVEDGQVSNLDGPIAITNGAKITVKDGGTLTIDGWVMNNGHIKVEEGGTLYIQDGACLNRYNEKYHGYGDIECKGLIIVGEEAKLIGGGETGLRLLNGSHVVNYGCVASENIYVANDHTIENRDKGFVLTGSGCGVVGSGYLTYSKPITYSTDSSGHVTGTLFELGAVEEICTVELADNVIYWE